MNMRTRINHLGLSLIELLVAIALGGILLGGAISLFVNNRATYEITNDMARLQENARFALQLMSNDIRMAGHVGCVNDVTKVNDNVGLAEGQLANFSHGIEGFESNAGAWLPSGHIGENGAVVATDSGAIIAGNLPTYAPFFNDSDGITVRYLLGDRSESVLADTGAGVDGNGDPLTGVDNEVVNKSPDDANDDAPVLKVRNLTHTLVDGQVAAVADCGAADLFIVNGASGTVNVNGTTKDTVAATAVDTVTAGGPATNLKRSYELLNRAVVMPFVGVRYFVRLNGANVPALFRTTMNTAAPVVNNRQSEITVELVDGVESMQILYGVDSDQDGTPNAFLFAGQTGVVDPLDATKVIKLDARNDFLAVIAIRISLLLRTVDSFGAVPTTDDELERIIYDVGTERFCPDTLVNATCTKFYPVDSRRRRVFQTTIAVRNFQ